MRAEVDVLSFPRGLPSFGGPVDILSLLDGGRIVAEPALDTCLLADWQEGLPPCERPFEAMAQSLGCEERTVIRTIRRLLAEGLVAHVGAVLTPSAFGASTLIGLRVPARDVDAMAGYLCLMPEIARVDVREYEYNLWTVISAATRSRLADVIGRIHTATRCDMLDLPSREVFLQEVSGLRTVHLDRLHVLPEPGEARLLEALRDNLPLVPRPFARLGMRAGLDEGRVIRVLQSWLASGAVQRLGLVLRPRLLGAQESALCAWSVGETEAQQTGLRLAALPQVRLVYRRQPHPGWPYNLYCSIHASDRGALRETQATLAAAAGLVDAPAIFMPLLRHCRRHEGRRPS